MSRHTRVGSGRAGDRRSAGKAGGLKRRSSLSVAGGALGRISKNSWKRLARRGGVKRISEGVYDLDNGIPASLRDFLKRILRRAVLLAEHCKRFTVITNDIAYALKQEGITLYKEGVDWSYARPTRPSRPAVRERISRPLAAALLVEAAVTRAQSEVGSVAYPADLQGTAAVAQQAVAEQQRQQAAAVAEMEALEQADGDLGLAPLFGEAAQGAGQEQERPADEAHHQEEKEEQAAPPSVARSAACAGVPRQPEEAAVAAAGEAAPMDVAAATPANQKAAPAAAAVTAAAAELLSPEAQQPATIAAGGKPATAAGLAVRRLSDVPTPVVMSAARALEVQGWMAEHLCGPLSQEGCVNKHELTRVMVAKHGCAAAEVQDVLFALERRKSIMMEADDIYWCGAQELA